MENSIVIKRAQEAEDFSKAKELILEYVQWLGFDLSHQHFDKEISTLPVIYGNPDGGLFIAFNNDQAVGVAGIKRFNETDCEVKRLFVQPGNRSWGIGKLLLTQCIELAKALNYTSIKLDTADFMKSAIKLYTENGFIEISAYRHNPYEHAKYFELKTGR